MKMRVRPAEVAIPEHSPFEHDLLARQKPAEILTELVSSIEGSCVLAVDAAWGAGKTTFFKMWAQYLRNNEFPVVSFNAWEADYAGDPFLSLVSEITEGLSEYKETAFSEKIQDTKEAAKKVLVRAIPGLLRIATAGILDIQPLIEKEAGQILSSFAETKIKKYQEAQSSITEFRAKLGQMAEALVESGGQRNLIVMIDELDRCRPSYAVELLEVAKHLFEVEHIVFALAVNRTQLSHSIRALYGGDFDAGGYLRRFFDVDFTLPDPDRSRFILALLDGMQIEDPARDVLQAFFSLPSVSLRQIGQSVHRLRLVVASLPRNRDHRMIAAVVALVIRTLDVDVYSQFVKGTVSDQDVVDRICERCGIADAVKESRSKRYGCSTFEAVVALAGEEISCGDREPDYEQEIKSELVEKYRQVINIDSDDIGTPAVRYADRVLRLVNSYRAHDALSMPYFLGFQESVRHIEMLTGGE